MSLEKPDEILPESEPETEMIVDQMGRKIVVRTDRSAFSAIGADSYYGAKGSNLRIKDFIFYVVGVAPITPNAVDVPRLDDPDLRLWIHVGDDQNGHNSYVDVSPIKPLNEAIQELADISEKMTPAQQARLLGTNLRNLGM